MLSSRNYCPLFAVLRGNISKNLYPKPSEKKEKNNYALTALLIFIDPQKLCNMNSITI